MKIRAGYEITYDCPQPTPMIVELSVHPIRRNDLVTPDTMRLQPAVPIKEYRDGFGNLCQVIKAPKGEMTMSSDFIIEDGGKPDELSRQCSDAALVSVPPQDPTLSLQPVEPRASSSSTNSMASPLGASRRR